MNSGRPDRRPTHYIVFGHIVRRLLRRPLAPSVQDDVAAARSIVLLVAYLLSIGVLHTLAMMTFEGLTPGDAAWLTVTTVTTVGYGDVSAASSAGRVSTVVLLYIGGIFALAKGAGDYFEYRASRRLRMIRGRWRWNMDDHILLINAPHDGAETYFNTLIKQFRDSGWGRDRPVMILTEAWPEGMPGSLQQLDVVHVHGRGDSDDALDQADAARAAAIIVLADEHADARADSIAFAVVHRLRDFNPDCPVLAECIDDGNRDRLRAAGATAVLRPMRGYPGMLVRAVVAPGSEFIIENLFTSKGDECVRYEVAVSGVAWGRLASELILNGVGTPIAFAADGDAIECNPLAAQPVEAKALYILVKEGHAVSDDEVRRLVGALAA